MVRYFYAWTPLVVVGTVVILGLPWLGLIALMLVSLVALAPLALAIVVVPHMLGRAISRRWHGRGGASAPPAVALRVYGHPYVYAASPTLDDRPPQLGRATESL